MRFCWMVLFAGALCAESNEEGLFVRRIADFWEEGEYQLAKGQIEEFITKYPESAYSDPLSAALGDLCLREKNFSAAFDHYSKISSDDFKEKALLNRMQCLYEMQWYATLADECEAILKTQENLHVTYFLAIALYHQCLNASQEPEQLLKLAERARPHFETLASSELSDEVKESYAHLCCILKDNKQAASIYLELAKQDPEHEEEMLFQAALIQSQYDKETAIHTFGEIVKMGQKRGKEASYNQLVLNFELGRYEELANPEKIGDLPPERAAMARLFLGRSYLNLKKYKEAVAELKALAEENSDPETLISLLDAAYQANDLSSFDFALEKFAAAFPKENELPKAYFSRAQMLKNEENYGAAKEQLTKILEDFPNFSQKAEVLFELVLLEHKEMNWAVCKEKATQFIAQYPEHPLISFAWRYLISSSTELGSKEELIEDLTQFMQTKSALSEEGEWELLLAKTHYELGQLNEANAILQKVNTPNGALLRAFTLKQSDPHQFIQIAKEALQQGANLIDERQVHLSLFNAYVELSQAELGAEHLYAALDEEIKIENLLWLGDLYFSQLEEEKTNFTLAQKTARVLSKCKAALHSSTPQSPNDEITCKLAEVHSILGQFDEAIALLNGVEEPKAKFILAEALAKKGKLSEAIPLYNAIVEASGHLRDPISAASSLELTRLKAKEENPNLGEIATELKNLVIQKNLVGEPVYLEAALDYIALQAGDDLEKKRALLEKTKKDFESRGDLLSNDYHEAREKFPQKNKLYLGYMELMEAEKHFVCNEKEQSRVILTKILNEQNGAALLERARMLLAKLDET